MNRYFTFFLLLTLCLSACTNEENNENQETTVAQPKEKIQKTLYTGSKDPIAQKINQALVSTITEDTEYELIQLDSTKEIALREEGVETFTFHYKNIDLNADGQDEYLVLMDNLDWCGTGGCSMWVFNSDFTLKSTFSLVKGLVFVDSIQTEGAWSNLIYQTRRYPGDEGSGLLVAEYKDGNYLKPREASLLYSYDNMPKEINDENYEEVENLLLEKNNLKEGIELFAGSKVNHSYYFIQ